MQMFKNGVYEYVAIKKVCHGVLFDKAQSRAQLLFTAQICSEFPFPGSLALFSRLRKTAKIRAVLFRGKR
jgi:hypothetical protein